MAYKSYSQRKWNHDYFAPFIYHIILKKRKEAPNFGEVVGNASIAPGKLGSARIDYSKMGYAIANALRDFDKTYPEFRKEQYSIMPDHIHIILNKLERTPIHLDDYMKKLKSMVADMYKKEKEGYLSPDEIFEDGYTDKLLFRRINLKEWCNYVAHNPHRRAMILQHEEFFQKVRNLNIEGKFYEAYGNLFLFRNPDKIAVRVRRNYTEKQKEDLLNFIMDRVEEGSILISPFISKFEKKIRDCALDKGAKIIILQHEKFGEKYKPEKRKFELCSQGRLLLISMGMPKETPSSYKINTEMNELAQRIANLTHK